jgi:2-isopropylmalate synthase
MTQLNLYDTTLRDGMQGQGMSLSAAEKVRVVQALDRLGVHFVEAGFPGSNPKETELFDLLARERGETACVRLAREPVTDGIAALETAFGRKALELISLWRSHLERLAAPAPAETPLSEALRITS